MNRLNELFERKKGQDILSVFVTAGFPNLDDTVSIIQKLEKEGVDFIEIGMPFSDPLADGPTIQYSSTIALNNGMTLNLLFEQLQNIRSSVNIPLILMGYLNPVMQYGIENFCKKCSEIGIDGLILPDLPMQEYLDDYKTVFDENGLSNIFLITPQTSDERIREIDENSNSFIYIVSTSSTTGKKKGIEGSVDYLERVNNMSLNNPTVIGFNISDNQSYTLANQYASGAIIGSAFIKAIENSSNLDISIEQFVQGIKGSVEA